MDAVRPPFVILSAVLCGLAFAAELGSRLFITVAGVPDGLARPGYGIASLAAVDGLLLLSLIVIALGAVKVSPHWLARLNGVATLIVSILTLLASIMLGFAAFALLMLMVGLLLAPPFGTAVYLATYGDFDRPTAVATLAILMLFKLASAILAVLGGQQILKSKSLILLFATSIGLTFLVSWLHGLPPGILVSITDAVGAIVAFVLAIIWSIVLLVGGVMGIVGNLFGGGRASGDD